MRLPLTAAALGVAGAMLLGCDHPQSVIQFGFPSGYPADAGSEADAGQILDGGSSTDGGSGPVDAGLGLPCDVQALLKTNCQTCHGSPPIAGAPMSMLTYANMIAPTPSNASLTVAQEAAIRMNDMANPMPPGGELSSSDIAVITDWVDAGTPPGTCD